MPEEESQLGETVLGKRRRVLEHERQFLGLPTYPGLLPVVGDDCAWRPQTRRLFRRDMAPASAVSEGCSSGL